jgi:mono/diheme cytochrome c family protein
MTNRLFALAVLLLLAALGTHAQDRTVWDGVYSAAQVERGDKQYDENCSACHGVDKMGGPGIPGLAGAEFLFNWNNKTVADLFDFLKTNMPPGQQGSLRDDQYLDIVAAIMKANEFPQGTVDLPADVAALKTIKISRTKP